MAVRRFVRCLLVALLLSPSLAVAGTWREGTIRVGSVERHYRVYVPDGHRQGAPTVLLLHGGTQSMREVVGPRGAGAIAWIDRADRSGALLLIPNGVDPDDGNPAGDDQAWNDLRTPGGRRQSEADDVGFLTALLDHAAATWGTTASRTLVTGASNGGMMAHRLLLEAPDRMAAVVAWIASLPEGLVLPPVARPVPMLIANGTQDPLIQWAGGTIRWRDGRTMPVPLHRDAWVRALGADAGRAVTRTLPDEDPADGCTLIETTYPAGPGGAVVRFLEMRGGGHAMPSRAHPLPNLLVRRALGNQCRDAEGVDLAWAFFETYGLRR